MTPPSRPFSAEILTPPLVHRVQLGLALLLTALSVIVHGSFALHHYALWRDEVNSVGLATMPTLRELWASLSYDSSPVLWPLIVRGWIFCGFGSSDASLRGLGFGVQMVLIGALWFNALSLGKRAPVLSLFLLGCQPSLALWPSLRSYGLGAALMLFTIGCLWRALENPGRKWVAFTVVLAVLSVQCVYVNVLMLAVVCAGGIAVCLFRHQKRLLFLPGAVFLVAALSMLIYLPTLSRIASWQMITVGVATYRAVLGSFISTLDAPVNFMHQIWMALCFVFLISVPVVLLTTRRNENQKSQSALIYAAVIVILSFSVTIFFLQKAGRATYPWHFLGLMALLGTGLDFLSAGLFKNSKWQLGLWVPVAMVGLSNFPFALEDVASRRTNVDLIASYLDKRAKPADLVVITSFYYGLTYQRYTQHKTPWVTAPDVGEYRINRYDILKHLMETPNSLARVQSLILGTLRGGHRVWLVGTFPPPPPEPPIYQLPQEFGKDGWYCPPYEAFCAAQVAYLLGQHGRRRAPVTIPLEGNFNTLEVAQVEEVEGWKN